LNRFRDDFAKVPLSVQRLLIDLDDLYLALNLRFFAAHHLHLALSDICTVHPLLKLVVLLLVKHFLLLQIYLSLLSFPLFLLGGFFTLDDILIYTFEVLELLHTIFQFNFDIL
jgi:hypothetical protein